MTDLTRHQVGKGKRMRLTRLDADGKPLGQSIVFRAREGGELAIEVWDGPPEEETP
jgi:signal transduction histidine kinase